MAYSNFTLAAVLATFQLKTIESADLFSEIETVAPSADLTTELKKKVPLATTIGTEKARSELIVANILVELREHYERRISLFSGIDFSVDVENGLTGVCDFLVSLSPGQIVLEAPVIMLVEAKKEDLIGGLGQCAAEMLAAQRFNGEKGNEVPRIYGTVTSGTDWLFLKLEEKCLHIDLTIYPIALCEKILGILVNMVAQKA